MLTSDHSSNMASKLSTFNDMETNMRYIRNTFKIGDRVSVWHKDLNYFDCDLLGYSGQNNIIVGNYSDFIREKFKDRPLAIVIPACPTLMLGLPFVKK